MDKSSLLNRARFTVLVSSLALIFFLFILNVLIRQFSDKSLWDISIAVFSLLGVLLTAGAAFATIAAIISYISVNDKLEKARIDLAKSEKVLKDTETVLKTAKQALKDTETASETAEKSLEDFKKLDDERKKLENKRKELVEANSQLEEYKIAVQGLVDNESCSEPDLSKYLNTVLSSEHTIFQDRIRANTIKSDIEAEENITAKEYKKAIELSEYAMECWKLLFLYNPEQNVSNYAKALFNLRIVMGN